ncbi:hypothetical protein BJV82DRAFT_672967 [Fennellomyces sp. T-0311]|nr:hypothetical protein BJV82DRAFT_672967 [Fennellomyces sp. T-0311]
MVFLLYAIPCLLLCAFAVNASYDMTDSMYSQLRMRSAPASFTINGTLYILGGYSPGLRERPILKQFTAISFNDEDGSVQHTDLTNPDTPMVAESYPVVLDNNRVLMLGGFCEMESGTACDNRTLFMAEYRFDSNTWISPRVPNVNVTRSLPPQTVSASLADDGLVYLRYNLAVGEVSFMPELWAYNPNTYTMTDLTRTVPDEGAFDNAAPLSLKLPNGEIAFIAEDMQMNYTMSILLLYNPTSQLWRVHGLQGEAMPYDRQFYRMAADPRGAKIYFFGGRARNLPNGSFNDLKVLDTTTWIWEDIEAVGTPPGGRFNLAMSFINDDLLVITCGTGDYFWFNDINAIRLADGAVPQWITNIMEPVYIPPNPDEKSTNTPAIIGGVVGTFVGVSLLALAVVFRRRVVRIVGIGYRLWLWSPRMGEPLWTETWRLVIKIILTTVTILIVVVNISNILNSPLVTISYIEDAPQVPVPDVRVCLDGVSLGFVGCLTDTISPQKCNDLGLVRPLDMSIHRPFLTQGTGDVSCFLFSTPDSFYLSSPESGQLVDNNGTRVTLRIGYMTSVPDVAPYVYLSLYPRGRDPNLVKYFQETQDLTDDQMALWLNQERSDTHPSNHYSIGIETFSTISYQHETRQTLTGSQWNRVGFFSEYNNSLELGTDFVGSPIDPTTQVLAGRETMQMVTLNPKEFINVRTRQQKLYTVVSVLGPVGGALALFGAFLVLLFGTRPNSPWGFVQQLSFGGAKRSLLYNLQDSFHPWASKSVPFVDFSAPLQQGSETTEHASHAIDMPSSANPFNDNGNQDIKQHLLNHMEKMEDVNRRLQLMEVVFKYYYIDPEVFNRISRAMEQDLKRENSIVTDDDRSSLTSPSLNNQDAPPPAQRSMFAGLLSRFGIVRSNRTGHEGSKESSERDIKRSGSRYSRLAPAGEDFESVAIDSHATLHP